MESTIVVRPLDEQFDLEVAERHAPWYAEQGYEWLSTSVFRNAARLSDVVIDIGAHVGWYSVQAGLCNTAARIISVEGSPATYEVLLRNLQSVVPDRTEPRCAVFGERSGRAQFHITEASDNCGLSGHPNSPTIEVLDQAMICGEDLGVDGEQRLLIKIDVEGHELSVLNGLSEVIDSATVVRMLVELNPSCLAAAESSPQEIVNWLLKRGFSLFSLNDHTRRWTRVPQGFPPDQIIPFGSYLNLYCVRGAEVQAIGAVLPSGRLGGAERSHLEWAGRMQGRGHLVHTYVGEGDRLPAALEGAGLTSSQHRLSWWVGAGDWTNATQGVTDLAEDLAGLNPDVVLTITGVIPGGALAASMLGVPHIWWIHEYIDLDHALEIPVPMRQLGSAMGELSASVLANSQSVYRHVLGEGEVRIAVPILPAPRPSDRTLVFEDEVQSPEMPVLGIFARVTERKGHLELVWALSLLRERGIELSLRVFGASHDHAFRSRLDSTIRQLGLGPYVDFMGETDDPAREMGSVDVVVVPSWHEAFGRVPVEAASAGTPVVYAAGGGLDDYMQDGVTGVRVQPRSPEALAAGIERVLADPALRHDLKAHACDVLSATLAPYDPVGVIEAEIRAVQVMDADDWVSSTIRRMRRESLGLSGGERNAAVVRMEAADAERDAAVAERDAAVVRMEAADAERDAAVAERYTIVNSRTWRWTAWYRGLRATLRAPLRR